MRGDLAAASVMVTVPLVVLVLQCDVIEGLTQGVVKE
jgi:ABC-type maltose transport system permease subunit